MNDLDILEKQLDSIYRRITKIEKRLKALRKSGEGRAKIPQYAHSAVFARPPTNKTSPYLILRNNSQRTISPCGYVKQIPKTNSGICLVPSPVKLLLPSSSSDESDSYSPCDEEPSEIVILEVRKKLPNWTDLILQHDGEIKHMTFENAKKVTSEDINLFF